MSYPGRPQLAARSPDSQSSPVPSRSETAKLAPWSQPVTYSSLASPISPHSPHGSGTEQGKWVAVSPWGTPKRNEVRISTLKMLSQKDPSLHGVEKKIFEERSYSPIRFLMLVLLFLLNISNASVAATFTTVAKEASAFYGVSLGWINSLYTANLIASFIFYFVASKVVDSYGIRVCFLLGGGFNTLGGLIRLWGCEPSMTSFLFLLTGTSMCAVGCPFLNDMAPALSDQWFPPNERSQATAVGSLSQFLGFLSGVVLGTCLIQNISYIVYIQTIGGAVPAVIGLCVFRDYKPSPDELTVGRCNELEDKGGVWTGLALLYANRDYVLIFAAMGLFFGVLYTLQGLVDQILPNEYKPYEYLLNVIPSVLGVVLGVAGGKYVDSTRKYALTLQVFAALSVALYGVFLFTVKNTTPLGMVVTVASLSLSESLNTGLLPLALELAVEVTFDPQFHLEGLSTALVLISTNLSASIFMYTTNLDVLAPDHARWCWGGLMSLGLLLFLATNDNLQRLQYEKAQLQNASLQQGKGGKGGDGHQRASSS